MFMEYFSLENYAGIFAGTLLNKIEIDFTLCKHRKIVIRGDGGSGKSTLLRCFSMFPDNAKEFRTGYNARKIGIINTGFCRYRFRIESDWNEKSKSRSTTRCFIEKLLTDGALELNPGGTVRSYLDVLETEFGIDPNFIALSFLSTEDKGIVGKTPTERKKMVSYALDDIEVYNNINKKISKKSNMVKAMLNNVANKINNIGNEDTINNRLKILEQQILYNSKQRDSLIANLGKIEAEINQLDPDGKTQALKKELIDRINEKQQDRGKLRNTLNYFASHEKHGLVDNELNDMDLATQKLLSINMSIKNFENKRDELKSKLQDLLVSQEEESRAIELKSQRLMTLQNECIYDNIEEQIEKYRLMIVEYEKMFDSLDIKNALSITKDEYVTGLTVAKDIKDMIDAFRSFVFPFTLEESVNAVRYNENKVGEYNELLVKRDAISSNLDELNKQYNYNAGLLDKMSALLLRPKECNINSCPFINEALEASKKSPQEHLDRLDEQIKANQNDLKKVQNRLDELEEVLSCIANLKVILKNIENNKTILSKLPIKEIFLDREILFKKIINMSSFDEINKTYESIKIAGIFEEYKIAKDNLYKLETDYKLYESRNIIIEELNNDIDNLTNKFNNVVSDIKEINNTIAGIELTIHDKQNLYDTTDRFIKMIKQFKVVDSELEEMKSRLTIVSSNMSKLDNTIERKINIEMDLNKVGEILQPLMAEREKLNYELDLLIEYKKEYEELSDKYTKLEIIKKYTSSSKKGIQNSFIEVYMNSTRTMANDILRLFFGGRLELYPYDLIDGFRIPCYSYYSGLLQNDVSECSRSEKAMATLAISISLMKQASESCTYNILKLDEIDEGLDTQNSNAFMPAMERIFEMLNIQQCLMVTHSDQIDLSDCDIIQLRRVNSNDDDMSQGNYIFTL